MTDTHKTPDGEAPRIDPAAYQDCEVDTLNLMWLLGARELARSDAEKAVLVYGLDREVLDILRHASLAMLHELAASGVLLFRPRFRVCWLQERLRTTGPSALGLGLQVILLAADEAAQP
ncbi:flagellar transcriptional regulator FlhD [Thiocapsa bogorovii]|uniref:flagellar transcriptional regulator FlhD n=1 Tax=Thiocapsa bogorovii TaxID=521689 RepID=UPI001E46380A|nr:flagellar transcriptional regulator FlhD [Thiocapsa bogorovii]UHD15027.1 flagellar transcriptional regulator FlhD [Thiocapsa bogorovii]